MSFEVYLLQIEDMHRVSTFPQPLCIQVTSHDDSTITSTPRPSENPKWDRSYSFLCYDKERLFFNVRSMHDDCYMESICEGELNLKSKPYREWDNSTVKIILNGPYRNEAILWVSLRWKNQKNEGVQECYRGGNEKEEKKVELDFFRRGEVFFKGACQSKNLFSFLDSKSKGQYFEVMEKQIAKR